MKAEKIENAIIIKNKTRLERLVERFNTKQQANFYINQSQEQFQMKSEGSSKITKKKLSGKKNTINQESASMEQYQNKNKTDAFSEYEEEHERFHNSLRIIQKQLSSVLKTKIVEHEFLPNYIFSKKDLVVVVGQDGLVANTAKYVHDIPIIAINPDETRYDGVLLPFTTLDFFPAVEKVINGKYNSESVTMAEAKLNDGQRLLAFNDFFIGPDSHTSARYKITHKNRSERQSSSGIIVSTGAGSTGWLSSLFNMASGIYRKFSSFPPVEPQILEWSARELIFVVREPFVSKTSKAEIVADSIKEDEHLILESYMPSDGIIFSDGILSDFIRFNSGAIATIGVAPETAKLVSK